MLVEMRVGCVAGFDLSTLNQYRWYPGLERAELDRRAGLIPLAMPPLQARGQHRGTAQRETSIWQKSMANMCSPVPSSHLRIKAHATEIRRLK